MRDKLTVRRVPNTSLYYVTRTIPSASYDAPRVMKIFPGILASAPGVSKIRAKKYLYWETGRRAAAWRSLCPF